MSTIWTPSGERPVGPPRPEPAAAPPSPPGRPPGAGGAGGPGGPGYDEPPLTEEEMAAELAEVQRRLAETPAAVVITNHAIGLFQLAALHLDGDPPALGEAQLAIDAMAALVEGVGDRLGEDGQALRDALAQLRLGFVQRKRQAGG